MLKPPKMISSVTVIQLVNKGLEDNKKKKAKDAGAKDKKKEEKKKKKKAKDSARKGTLPQHEIENVFYWAE